MFRLSTCLLLLVACHGSNPPAEPSPGGPPPPVVDPKSEPTSLPPEPNSPSDAQTMAPGVGATAKTSPVMDLAPPQTGGLGGGGGLGGMSGTGGTAPVHR